MTVTVAIPVRDGGELLGRVLSALATQTVAHELLVCDSGSLDRSPELAREHGARVIEIASSQFSHGGTRNLLMSEASGTHVAFLTQDAEPADDRWLERLVGGFELAADVGVVYGAYRPRAGAAAHVRMELERWFSSLAPDGEPSVEGLTADERTNLAVRALMGRRGFLTDANACLARHAWERVPFRDVPYAEDRVLAMDLLRGGYAKVFVPQAVVLHSHDYTTLEELRRAFDEGRGLREVYGWREPAAPAILARNLRGALGQARCELAHQGVSLAHTVVALAAVAWHHVVRLTGALLGSRADLLPDQLTRRLSLERRAGFEPLDTRPAQSPAKRDP